MALLVGGIILLVTVVATCLIIFANMMQSAPKPSNQTSPWFVLVGGLSLAALITGSHWMHLSW